MSGAVFHRSGSLVPVKGNLNPAAYIDILDNSALSTLWQHFGEGPFLFQHDSDPVHKARSIQKGFLEIGVDALEWPAQSPDLKPIEHLSDELEPRLRASVTVVKLLCEFHQVHISICCVDLLCMPASWEKGSGYLRFARRARAQIILMH